MRLILTCFLFIFSITAIAQVELKLSVAQLELGAGAITDIENKPVKKVLTHKDYDQWESIGEKAISNNGKIIVYVVNPQEGDGNLYIKNEKGKLLKQISRGYNPVISNDNNFIFCKIKPLFKDTREAKIKKKKADEMPKDTLVIYEIAKDSLQKIPKIKSFKTPEKGSGWLAYLLEKTEAPKSKTIVAPDSVTQINTVIRMADSLRKIADSLVLKTKEAKDKGLFVLLPPKKEVKAFIVKPVEDIVEEGTDLVLRNLATGKEQIFKLTNEYYFDKYAKKLLIETSKKNGDSLKKAMVLWQSLQDSKVDTLIAGFNDAKNYAVDEKAEQIAFVVEKDSVAKALQKFYKLYYYKNGMVNAVIKVDKTKSDIAKNVTISPDFNNVFSKDGEQLYFGLAPIRKPKDTTLVDFETAKLDVWTYKDDYLQPQQLVQLTQELKRSYTSVLHTNNHKIVVLGTDTTENIGLINEGNAKYVLSVSTKGNRAAQQWQGFSLQNSFLISTETGTVTNILENSRNSVSMSPVGKYAYWYDYKTKHWFTYNVSTKAIKNITLQIKVPLYDEEDDHPDEPFPHGIMRWSENDQAVFVYDKYDIWKCNPDGNIAPQQITKGRKNKVTTRWINTDNEERSIVETKQYLFTEFDNTTKKEIVNLQVLSNYTSEYKSHLTTKFRGFLRAKDSLSSFLYTCENPTESPYLVSNKIGLLNSKAGVIQNSNDVETLHKPNPQQADYNWYNNELVTWKMYDGKMSEGILYKPENFDATKKYPIIFYFYERDADDLYNYKNFAPSASTINIPYFTSNGYLVFDPNIYYKNGEPGESAYNSVVSAANYLSKKYKWVDSTKMAIQGQSWGGYQVAYLVTRTNIFAAAGAGAPVSNMTSAYGGIRWGSGVTRQFQYEKGQTRIGKTLWDGRDLYLKNSPLFAVPKVKTPLLLMHNDKDGAVPWYQSIEFFTALKRNDKKVWLLQYNDEDHNLIERRNRKDLSIRLGQFFDHYLKGKPMPKWMSEGVPATEKGVEWGL
jgi:dipeptidyl aminopeptidase/acylaminoacyl peptidase